MELGAGRQASGRSPFSPRIRFEQILSAPFHGVVRSSGRTGSCREQASPDHRLSLARRPWPRRSTMTTVITAKESHDAPRTHTGGPVRSRKVRKIPGPAAVDTGPGGEPEHREHGLRGCPANPPPTPSTHSPVAVNCRLVPGGNAGPRLMSAATRDHHALVATEGRDPGEMRPVSGGDAPTRAMRTYPIITTTHGNQVENRGSRRLLPGNATLSNSGLPHDGSRRRRPPADLR
jgi:hypothetical protein